ncbi:putative 3',5'-cyclic-nucleotide phosphodiesterase [Actinacidiphila bryophytorum]|uniref:3',5'-cyclic-nucleotide phosphodiesterase n=1 Tax=Actinacidiphila bryophytorum TaxID=1436133 RepID=A0A9W4MBE1_9ACTN|nr:putative 3',5'-cyclic-nucleotide phosphodiesterase [Actinacidiphila bryophytorum]
MPRPPGAGRSARGRRTAAPRRTGGSRGRSPPARPPARASGSAPPGAAPDACRCHPSGRGSATLPSHPFLRPSFQPRRSPVSAHEPSSPWCGAERPLLPGGRPRRGSGLRTAGRGDGNIQDRGRREAAGWRRQVRAGRPGGGGRPGSVAGPRPSSHVGDLHAIAPRQTARHLSHPRVTHAHPSQGAAGSRAGRRTVPARSRDHPCAAAVPGEGGGARLHRRPHPVLERRPPGAVPGQHGRRGLARPARPGGRHDERRDLRRRERVPEHLRDAEVQAVPVRPQVLEPRPGGGRGGADHRADGVQRPARPVPGPDRLPGPEVPGAVRHPVHPVRHHRHRDRRHDRHEHAAGAQRGRLGQPRHVPARQRAGVLAPDG